jgi:hypothetical protein
MLPHLAQNIFKQLLKLVEEMHQIRTKMALVPASLVEHFYFWLQL